MLDKEKTIKERLIYKGKIITLKEIDILTSNNHQSKREIIEHRGAVAIVAIDKQNKIPLVRQYRKAVESFLWEIPAGRIEEEENPLCAAKREFKEETGLTAENWSRVSSVYSSPGFTNENIHIYLAKNLKQGKQMLDSGEFLEIKWFSLDDLKKLIETKNINDAKTLIAVQYLLLKYE